MSECVLVGGASTQSRGRRPLPPGAIRGQTLSVDGVREQVRFTKADGTSYDAELLSWVGGQSGLLFGNPSPHSTPDAIWSAIKQHASDVHGSYGHRAEYQLADALGRALDGVFSSDAISCRFGLNGKDAVDAAVRVARAVTGRSKIAMDGSYHGAGEAVIHAPFPGGVPVEYQSVCRYFTWGDVEQLRRYAPFAAAILVDVPALPDEEITPFLKEIRKACDEYGSVFILDEVVSGFKFSLGGAAKVYGVKPDIACYGKCMSAVGKTSAIVGRKDMVDYLDGRTFHSLTFGGDPYLCAVSAATIEWLIEHEHEVYGEGGHLRKTGRALQDGLNQVFARTGTPCVVKGQPERSVMIWDTNENWLNFCSNMIGQNIVVHRPQFPCLAHQLSDVEKTLEVARECL